MLSPISIHRYPLRKYRRRIVRRTQSEPDINDAQLSETEQTSQNPAKVATASKLENFTKKLFNRTSANASKDNAVDSPKKVSSSSSMTWMENLW